MAALCCLYECKQQRARHRHSCSLSNPLLPPEAAAAAAHSYQPDQYYTSNDYQQQNNEYQRVEYQRESYTRNQYNQQNNTRIQSKRATFQKSESLPESHAIAESEALGASPPRSMRNRVNSYCATTDVYSAARDSYSAARDSHRPTPRNRALSLCFIPETDQNLLITAHQQQRHPFTRSYSVTACEST